MTTYRPYTDSALRTLKSGLPNARVAVISIPDVYRLWYIGRTNLTALSVWETYGKCQSMLDRAWSTSSTDEARRQRVRQRVIAYNIQLAEACAAYGPKCNFDDNAVFNYRFILSQVSGWDYFHPSTSGQEALAPGLLRSRLQLVARGSEYDLAASRYHRGAARRSDAAAFGPADWTP